MGHAEKRGNNTWRARWRGPSGVRESKDGFTSKRAAEKYAHDQEAKVRSGTAIDHRAGQTTLSEWVNLWWLAQDLEPSTLADYRNRIEVRILPTFGDRALVSITPEEVAVWERALIARGYAKRTAQAARSLLATILGDAIPRYIQTNPAVRRRGRGRIGLRRIEERQKTEKAWAAPLQALLIAERCAALSGHNSDFVMMIAAAYTGLRWSELQGLSPAAARDAVLDVEWKLYELDGRFYQGPPKDGSARTIDLPPFLTTLLTNHLKTTPTTRCTCRASQPPWCDGTTEYVWLGPQGGHHRRSNYARRILRPAADGWYPATGTKPTMPVLVDATTPPGKPLPPWPAAEPGRPLEIPTGRGRRRVPDGVPVASWLPALPALTAHGFRHGHQTWLEEWGIPYVLIRQRMGHEITGMRGVYTHVSPAMREHLTTALQTAWSDSLAARSRIHPRSSVPALDELLTERSTADPPPNRPQNRAQERRRLRPETRT